MITTTKTTYEVGLLYEKKSSGFYNKEAIVEVQPDISSIYVKYNNSLEKLMCSMIHYIEAAGSYCKICMSDDKRITIAQPLGDFITSLPSDIFIRVHRSYAINICHVEKYSCNIFYINNNAIPIGRAYKQEALSHFNIASKGL